MESTENIVSPSFQLDRRRFGKVATLFFIRRYWVVYAFAVLIGLALLLFQREGLGLWVGIIFVVYPFTVPIRYSMVVTAKASSFLEQDTTYEVESNSFLIRNDLGGRTQAQMSAIRSYEVISDTLVMLFGKATFLMLPLEILEASQRQIVMDRVHRRGI